MACTKFNDNQTQIRSSNISGLSVWGGPTGINWSQLDIKTI